MTVRVSAPNFTAAEDIGYSLAMPLLSWWSFRFDVAIDVTAWQVVEESTESVRWRFGVLGQERIVDTAGGLSDPRFRPVLAAYREGMNATNSFYRVLCFYKVVEGCRKLRLARRQKSPRRVPDPVNERFPSDLAELALTEEERFPFTPYAGWTFGRVLETLRGSVRNALAHLDPSGDSVNTDSFSDNMQCEQAAPVLKHIARAMLRNELVAEEIPMASVTLDGGPSS
jgi:hypothetical protein